MSWPWIIGVAVVGYIVYKYITTEHFSTAGAIAIPISIAVIVIGVGYYVTNML